jgi:hypothetical protein
MATPKDTKVCPEGRGGSLLRGILVPEAWDENGNIVRMALATAEEEHYVVDLRGREKDVTHLIREKVTVLGQIRNEGNQAILEVEDYWLG